MTDATKCNKCGKYFDNKEPPLRVEGYTNFKAQGKFRDFDAEYCKTCGPKLAAILMNWNAEKKERPE